MAAPATGDRRKPRAEKVPPGREGGPREAPPEANVLCHFTSCIREITCVLRCLCRIMCCINATCPRRKLVTVKSSNAVTADVAGNAITHGKMALFILSFPLYHIHGRQWCIKKLCRFRVLFHMNTSVQVLYISLFYSILTLRVKCPKRIPFNTLLLTAYACMWVLLTTQLCLLF